MSSREAAHFSVRTVSFDYKVLDRKQVSNHIYCLFSKNPLYWEYNMSIIIC